MMKYLQLAWLNLIESAKEFIWYHLPLKEKQKRKSITSKLKHGPWKTQMMFPWLLWFTTRLSFFSPTNLFGCRKRLKYSQFPDKFWILSGKVRYFLIKYYFISIDWIFPDKIQNLSGKIWNKFSSLLSLSLTKIFR